MKLEQILCVTLATMGALTQAAPATYSKLSDLQKNANLYADSMMHAKYDSDYFQSYMNTGQYPSITEFDSEHPGELDQIASDFITGQNYTVSGVSSSDLVNYLKSAYASESPSTAITDLIKNVSSLSSLNLPAGSNYVSKLDYLIKNDVTSDQMSDLRVQSYANNTLPEKFIDSFNPNTPSVPGGGPTNNAPSTGTGTGTAADQAYQQALAQYQAQVKTTAGLSQLESQLSTLDQNVANIQAKIKAAQDDGNEDISDLDAQLTQALADQVAARDAIRKADPVEPVDG
mgnify:CR=1 FL=1